MDQIIFELENKFGDAKLNRSNLFRPFEAIPLDEINQNGNDFRSLRSWFENIWNSHLVPSFHSIKQLLDSNQDPTNWVLSICPWTKFNYIDGKSIDRPDLINLFIQTSN